jgi:hypothetical protein
VLVCGLLLISSLPVRVTAAVIKPSTTGLHPVPGRCGVPDKTDLNLGAYNHDVELLVLDNQLVDVDVKGWTAAAAAAAAAVHSLPDMSLAPRERGPMAMLRRLCMAAVVAPAGATQSWSQMVCGIMLDVCPLCTFVADGPVPANAAYDYDGWQQRLRRTLACVCF